jgi:hypothetical protein
MNIFINIFESWTMYEWVLLGGSLILIFLLSNLGTYLLTKDWRFNKSISLTYIICAVVYTLTITVAQFFPVSISYISLIPIPVITLLITINWFTLVSYYSKHRNRKGFSLLELLTEQRKDTIRNIIFLTLAILSVLTFLHGELFLLFSTIYIPSVVSMYLNTFLTQKFLND